MGTSNGSSPPPSTAPLAKRAEFLLGIRLHNEGEFYEAHEAWEEIWSQEEDDEIRLFLQGLIQVTSAFHKLVFQREPGSAMRLLERGLAKLEGYPADYAGVDLGRFRERSRDCVGLLATLEPSRAGAERFDRTRIPHLTFVASAPPT